MNRVVINGVVHSSHFLLSFLNHFWSTLLSPTHSERIQAEWLEFGRNEILVNTQPNLTSA